jgi:two-component system response regulator
MSTYRKVLMVDDDQHDVYLTKRAFNRLDWKGEFDSVCGGSELFEYLGITSVDSNQSKPSSTELPDVLLLDLNMPCVDGFDVLRRLRSTEHLAHLPIVVLTTSESPDDVHKAYLLGANSFICKPSSLSDLTHLATMFRDYWFELTRLPASVH